MVDWTSSMQQYFEYYTVDPGTWCDDKKLTSIKSCTITRDSETDTLGSATFDTTELLGECYIRVYLITVQNGVTEKHPLGTFLAQTPNTDFDGKVRSISVDAYTPLIELKENQPEIGYYTPKYDDYKFTTLDSAYLLAKEHARAPVIKPSISELSSFHNGLRLTDNFIAESNETWISYIRALIASAKHEFALDEMGRIMFNPVRELDSIVPVWTYDDGNSSILYPELSIKHDLFGIPNVVEVFHSTSFRTFHVIAVNEDPNSPVSTISRGRRIAHRVSNPSGLSDYPNQQEVEDYAIKLLRTMSTLKCTVRYTHGYCPVRLGDCVRLDYKKAGLTNIKAKVINQNILCSTGCQVNETAVFDVKLWR